MLLGIVLKWNLNSWNSGLQTKKTHLLAQHSPDIDLNEYAWDVRNKGEW